LDIIPHINKLKLYIEKEDFKGYDPYDALNSPTLKTLSFNRKYLRIAFIQALKRLPINLRPLFFIEKDYNPKGLGLFLWGYAKLYKIEKKPEYLVTIKRLLDLIESLKSIGYSGNCWGYNFDWQSRAFYVPKYTPTIVNSSFIGHALLDTYLYTGKQQALHMAISIKNFITKDLNRKYENGKFCFSYTPIDSTAVHNANLLGSSLLIRLYKYVKEPLIRDTAMASLEYSMKYQLDNGSWYYAETEIQKWIDSFHTGFILQCIKYFHEEGFAKEYKYEFDNGVKFYSDNFFLEDGTPKYYHNKTYSIDIHSPAQAIVFFSRLESKYRALNEKILKWMITNMQDEQGYFYFQKHKYCPNKIPYMRWSQAWAFHALTEYLLHNHNMARV
jgi:rhamnogalacturonyl hydrolase YesR